MSVRIFGETPEGVEVREATLETEDLSVSLIEYGCATREIRLKALDRPLSLGFDTLEGYLRDTEHVGVIAGRCANRLAGGRFEIDGVAHQATRNIEGRDTLHGGERGFGRRIWRLVDHGRDHATFAIRSADGEEGFPGALEAVATYRVDQGKLEIDLSATAEAPTICNLAQHSYYNLSGANLIDDHVLTLASRRVTTLNEHLTPTGEVADVREELDFSAPRAIGAGEIDVNYVLATGALSSPRFAARLEAGGVSMTMETTAPGLQVYSGDNMPAGETGGFGRVHGPRAGFCLEPQHWPNAPQHADFPSIFLRPGETWRQKTRLFFAFGKS